MKNICYICYLVNHNQKLNWKFINLNFRFGPKNWENYILVLKLHPLFTKLHLLKF